MKNIPREYLSLIAVAASVVLALTFGSSTPALQSSGNSSSSAPASASQEAETPPSGDTEQDGPPAVDQPGDGTPQQPENPSTGDAEEDELPSVDQRGSVVAAGLTQRGEVIGTGGKPAVALRFDHHLDDFDTKVLPLLEKYRLPWGQMINAGRVNNPSYDDNWTWEQLASEAHGTGGEIWNHAMTHKSFTTAEEADYEITEGLNLLREELPTLYIDGWAGPGQPELMGMEGSDTPDKFYGTYPGRLVLNQHAFVRGYYPDPYQPLDGDNLVGTAHVTIDKQKNGRVQQYVRRVLGTTNGVTLMLHPNYLDQDGYLTTNELDAALGYIAHLRDTGQIEVLSNAGILMADATLPEQEGDLLEMQDEGEIAGDLTAQVPAALDHLGVPHELEVWMTGEGSATVRVDIDSVSHPVEAEYTTQLTGEDKRLSLPVTPPRDTTQVTVTISGNGTYRDVSYRPI